MQHDASKAIYGPHSDYCALQSYVESPFTARRFRNLTISTNKSNAKDNVTSKAETAAVVGSTSCLTASQKRLGNVLAAVPLMKSAMSKSSNDAKKAKKEAVRTAGLIMGSVTRRKADIG